MKIPNKKMFTLCCIVLGYLGAAMYYSYLIGVNFQAINVDVRYVCPACPNIDSIGSPLAKFIGRTLTLGSINATLFLIVGWLIYGPVMLIRLMVKKES